MRSSIYKITVEMIRLKKVTMSPGFRNSKKLILTLSFSADSITMRFAIAPKIVAFPASVEADARDSQIRSPALFLRMGSITMVKGTLLII